MAATELDMNQRGQPRGQLRLIGWGSRRGRRWVDSSEVEGGRFGVGRKFVSCKVEAAADSRGWEQASPLFPYLWRQLEAGSRRLGQVLVLGWFLPLCAAVKWIPSVSSAGYGWSDGTVRKGTGARLQSRGVDNP